MVLVTQLPPCINPSLRVWEGTKTYPEVWSPRQKAQQPPRQGERCPFCLCPCSHRQHGDVIGDVPLHGLQYFPATSSALHVQSVPVTSGSTAAASLIRTRFRRFPEYTRSCLTFPPVLNTPYLTQPQRCHHRTASLKTRSYTVFEWNTANCCHYFAALHWGCKKCCF